MLSVWKNKVILQTDRCSIHENLSQFNNMRKAVFLGSFDPYTIGHHSIVRRALPLFDSIVIGIGHNERKQYMLSAEERLEAIRKVYADEPRIEVKTFDDLAVNFARREGAQFILRGVRTVKDFEFEREQADFNRRLSGVETIILFAEPGMESISSTNLRELIHFGQDVTKFLP